MAVENITPPVSLALEQKIVDTPLVKSPTTKPIGMTNSLSKLDKLRKQVAGSPASEEQLMVDTEATTLPEIIDNNPFTQAELMGTWIRYIQLLSELGKNSLAVIYKNTLVKLTENTILELTLSSQHEREMIEDDRINITPFLRSNLQNTSIDFSFIINSTLQPFKAFTAEDKFKLMADKNPVLNEFRQVFGLELE
jgi:DNA polymerase-3 subunit gamma/tau